MPTIVMVPVRVHDPAPLFAALEHVWTIYRSHRAGCCWHLVLDDGNVDSVDFCAQYARDNGSGDCRTRDACTGLADLAPQLSESELLALYIVDKRR